VALNKLTSTLQDTLLAKRLALDDQLKAVVYQDPKKAAPNEGDRYSYDLSQDLLMKLQWKGLIDSQVSKRDQKKDQKEAGKLLEE
jgi:hypothetical protein